MWNFRLILGLVCFLTGVVLAALAGWDGRFWGAVGFFVAGIAVAITVIAWDFYSEPVFWFAPILGAVLTIVSVADVFTSSHAVNYKETEAQDDFLNALIELQVDGSPMTAREKKLVGEAFRVCALQGNQDQLELVFSAQKAIYFGPALTLVDGVNSEITEQHPVRCLDYYRELRKTRASLFTKMERRNSWLLENFSSDPQ
ncbi:hypothetical protein ACQKP5_00925 [Pseudomonas vancouverensis]|uniref:hypothetical protein n=1 Tax=Pseudomonas vancouverensis TaxID=95300 RepID=UPI003D082707